MQKVSTQKGFTLIELIIVIVLLGILAVTAAPKFLNLQDDARDSVLQGIAGSLESASSVVYGKALIADAAGTSDASQDVDVGDADVTLVFGYPAGQTAGNFTALLDLPDEYAVSAVSTGFALIYYTGFGTYSDTAPTASGSACTVEYTNPTAAGERPEITVNTCVQ